MQISIGPANINLTNPSGANSSLGNIASVNVNLNNAATLPNANTITLSNDIASASANLVHSRFPNDLYLRRFIRPPPTTTTTTTITTSNTYIPVNIQAERGSTEPPRNLPHRTIEELIYSPIIVQSRLNNLTDNNNNNNHNHNSHQPYAIRVSGGGGANRHLHRSFLVIYQKRLF